MQNSKSPFVFEKHLFNWKTFQKWSLEYLTEIFSRKVKFQIGKINENRENIRNDSEQIELELTFKEFKDWSEGKTVQKLIDFDRKSYYAYCSYQYVNELFSNEYEHLIDDIDWSYFGLEKHLKYQTVFWLGSTGSYTNCHYDTYGSNIICQLRGCKRWLLFPPSDTKNLYPTRFPYEESSVFSCVDFRSVNLSQYPLLNETNPYLVTLEPGDVLILPYHWWHFVQIEDDESDYSLSINLWLDDDQFDLDNRISEALTKLGLLSFFDSDLMSNYSAIYEYSELLNEKWTVETIEILNGLLEERCRLNKTKKHELSGLENGKEVSRVRPCEIFPAPIEDDDCFEVKSNIIGPIDILDAFTHPDVISVVQKVLLEKYK